MYLAYGAAKGNTYNQIMSSKTSSTGVTSSSTGSTALTADELAAYQSYYNTIYNGSSDVGTLAVSSRSSYSTSSNPSSSTPSTDPTKKSVEQQRAESKEMYRKLDALKGNGDFQIESFIGQGDPNAEIPPINTDLAFWNEMGFGTGKTDANGTSSTPITVVRTDDTNADKRINAVLRNTFEVKSKTIESYLKQILEAVESRGKTWSEAYDGTQSNTKLFDEHIPSQVAKLSIG